MTDGDSRFLPKGYRCCRSWKKKKMVSRSSLDYLIILRLILFVIFTLVLFYFILLLFIYLFSILLVEVG